MATVYGEFEVAGCTDAPVTTTQMLPKRFMQYAEVGYDCDGLLGDVDGDGVCDEFELRVADDSLATTTLTRLTKMVLDLADTATIATAFA